MHGWIYKNFESKMSRRGRPTKAYLDTLRKKPKKADYERLVTACIESLISGDIDVMVSFSYLMNFPKGFPVGILEEKVGDKNIHRIKARRLLNWLYAKGYTNINSDDVKNQKGNFSRFETRMDKLFTDCIDEDQEICHNEDIQIKEGR